MEDASIYSWSVKPKRPRILTRRTQSTRRISFATIVSFALKFRLWFLSTCSIIIALILLTPSYLKGEASIYLSTSNNENTSQETLHLFGGSPVALTLRSCDQVRLQETLSLKLFQNTTSLGAPISQESVTLKDSSFALALPEVKREADFELRLNNAQGKNIISQSIKVYPPLFSDLSLWSTKNNLVLLSDFPELKKLLDSHKISYSQNLLSKEEGQEILIITKKLPDKKRIPKEGIVLLFQDPDSLPYVLHTQEEGTPIVAVRMNVLSQINEDPKQQKILDRIIKLALFNEKGL